MLPIPRRSQAVAPIGHETAAGLPVSPSEFVYDQQEALHKSAGLWRGIAQQALDVEKDPETLAALQEALVAVYEQNGTVSPAGRLERETNRLASGVAIFAVLLARYMSADSPSIRTIATIRQEFRGLHPQLFDARDRHIPKHLARHVMIRMMSDMQTADKLSTDVLGSLAEQYSARPEGLIDLAQAYRDGAAADPAFAELKAMVATDWGRPDTQNSLLRRYLRSVAGNRQLYVADFGRHVAAAEKREKETAIRDMAQFAIALTARHGIELSVEEAITSMADEWSEFDVIAGSFKAFVDDKLAGVEAAIRYIASPINPRSIRMPRTREQIQEFRTNFYYNSQSRRVRRRAGMVRAKNTAGLRDVPDDNELSRVAGEEGPEEPGRRLMIAKQVPHGPVQLVEAEAEEVVKAFVDPKKTSPSQDIPGIIARLAEQPMSRASALLRGHTITLENDAGSPVIVPLRRFAAEKGSRLGRRGDSAYRIVYALVDGQIIIADILTHEDFNKKY
jgi:hypothetical protein